MSHGLKQEDGNDIERTRADTNMTAMTAAAGDCLREAQDHTDPGDGAHRNSVAAQG